MNKGHGIAWVVLMAVLVLPVPASDDPPGESTTAGGEAMPKVHLEPSELVDGAVEAVRAYLLEDAPAMRAALDRIEQATRRLDRERDEALGSDLIIYEQAFHETLDRAREASIRGQLEEAFNQFVWTQRACVTCHGIARDQGLLDD